MLAKAFFHLLLASVFSFTIYYDLYQLRIPDVMRIRLDKSAGRWKYLTFWNLLAQAAFFALSFINDLASPSSGAKGSKLSRFLDTMFTAIGFPIAIFVASTFWTLMLINRELVFPSIFDSFFPFWLNHLMHTLIVPAVVGEMLLVRHYYPGRKLCLGILSFFTTLYLIWTFVVAYVWQFWTYPVLEVLNWGQRVAFIVICIIFTWIFYFIGEFIYKLRWKGGEKGAKGGNKQQGSKSGDRRKKKKTN